MVWVAPKGTRRSSDRLRRRWSLIGNHHVQFDGGLCGNARRAVGTPPRGPAIRLGQQAPPPRGGYGLPGHHEAIAK